MDAVCAKLKQAKMRETSEIGYDKRPKPLPEMVCIQNSLRPARSDRQIARTIFASFFGENDVNEANRPILFSKMLRGEYGLQPEIASELAKVMNAAIEVYRGGRKLSGPSPQPLRPDHLYGPLFDFIRTLIAAVEQPGADDLVRTHRKMLDEFAPKATEGNAAHLLVERFATDRFIEGMRPSGGDGPVVFKAGQDLGQLSIQGLDREPLAAYALVARDPSPESWIWDSSWGETISWLPSPFKPIRSDNRYNLLPNPRKVQPVGGRFLVTALVVLEQNALAKLDPRGPTATAAALDENQTAKFLTEAKRLASGQNAPVVVATNEYRVALP